ncbi:putative C-type lectin domain family 20 member A [Colossoma macropomum]|uniref:putative C-type lectin domain family 20 member A n=1 Tax=Colossoma macropomum TaxID=42526 RepID=UPI00186455A8|nr:putative C-type lectin domain family 20 member A [Colossoma macropomum]
MFSRWSSVRHKQDSRNNSNISHTITTEITFSPVFSDSYSDKTYYLMKKTNNWADAKRHCERHYKDLAIIYNQGDWQKALAALNSLPNEVWIGLHKDPKLKWSNGEDFMYFNWAAGWDTSSGHDCVYSVSGKWWTENCLGPLAAYMCQKVTNMVGIMRKTYTPNKVTETWDSAQKACNEQNGELASVTNKQDQEEFDKIAPNNTNIWIGLKRDNDVWKWSSEEPFQNWATNDFSSMKNCTKLSGDKKLTPEDFSKKKNGSSATQRLQPLLHSPPVPARPPK